MPEPSFGWSYLSREALECAKAQLDGESAGVRDEVGFLALHQGYADRFFPGTSVLHSHPRYALFVPWHFQDLEGATGEAGRTRLKLLELDLAKRLKAANQTHVIGGRNIKKAVAQPPSTVYWNALGAWGVLRRLPGSERWASRPQVMQLMTSKSRTLDEDGQPLHENPPPFAGLPDPPPGWRGEGPITFDLLPDEAAFLRDRLTQLMNPREAGRLSLLAWLIRNRRAPVGAPWLKASSTAQRDAAALGRSAQVASLAAVGRGVYAALVERLRDDKDGRSTQRIHRDNLQIVVQEHGPIVQGLDMELVEADVGKLAKTLRQVCVETMAWIGRGASDPDELLDAYVEAERRKGRRARLDDTVDAFDRRAEWQPDQHTKAEPLHYRWSQVRTLLRDLKAAA